MTLDADLCYEALRSKDARFDGRFFTAVMTTGVYCRPICPARLPKRENVRFFACAAAAEEAGFRPCRRCRPETSPGTPAWLGTSTTVSRALRLISEGALDDGGVADLADRLGIGDRHLRRLFLQHLGATPVRVAETRRVHFARKLIDETNLPMSDIAFSSGFGSVRRFNEAVKSTFGRCPTEIRGSGWKQEQRGNGNGLSLRLPFRIPFDWDGLIAFLGPRTIPGVESVSRDGYRRSVTVDGLPGEIEVRPVAGQPYLRVNLKIPTAKGLASIVERLRRVFDLGADPLEINRHLSRDPILARRVRTRPGIRVPGAWDRFELSVRAILGQQITVAGATTIAGRLVEAFGTRLSACDGPGITHLFPRPEDLAEARIETCGVPRQRAESIRILARKVYDGDIVLESGIPAEDLMDRMREIPGVGAWTTEYIAMRAFSEPDAFPSADLGIRRALGEKDGVPTAASVARRAEAWRPWRAYAVMHLWTNSL